jgi:hypothetical protein
MQTARPVTAPVKHTLDWRPWLAVSQTTAIVDLQNTVHYEP